VLSITPVILQETGTVPSGIDPDAITINGQRFAEEDPGAGTFNINTTAPGVFTVLKTL
jgi:hypothetical protein